MCIHTVCKRMWNYKSIYLRMLQTKALVHPFLASQDSLGQAPGMRGQHGLGVRSECMAGSVASRGNPENSNKFLRWWSCGKARTNRVWQIHCYMASGAGKHLGVLTWCPGVICTKQPGLWPVLLVASGHEEGRLLLGCQWLQVTYPHSETCKEIYCYR